MPELRHDKGATGNKPSARTDNWFERAAKACAAAAGHPWAFVLAAISLVAWALLGPRFHYSNAWQLVINSLTNIVTFLMVFIIQNSQNRDTKAVHLKLDELIRAQNAAQNEMIDIEKLSDKELEQLASRYERIRNQWEQRKSGVDQRHPAA